MFDHNGNLFGVVTVDQPTVLCSLLGHESDWDWPDRRGSGHPSHSTILLIDTADNTVQHKLTVAPNMVTEKELATFLKEKLGVRKLPTLSGLGVGRDKPAKFTLPAEKLAGWFEIKTHDTDINRVFYDLS